MFNRLVGFLVTLMAQPFFLYKIEPPLAMMTCPLIHSLASLAKNPTTFAMSLVSPSLPNRFYAFTFSTISLLSPAKNISVATGPGETQFTVICVPLSSFARILDMASMAAFEAVYEP